VARKRATDLYYLTDTFSSSVSVLLRIKCHIEPGPNLIKHACQTQNTVWAAREVLKAYNPSAGRSEIKTLFLVPNTFL